MLSGIDRERGADAWGIARVMRFVVVTFAPTLIAFASEWMVFASVGSRWLLMVAAVVVSAAGAGMVSGLVATILSASLVWWFLVPPVQRFGAAEPASYLTLAFFVAIGYAISLMHGRLRATSDGLARVARQNHIFAALIDNSLDFIGIADPEGNPVYLNPAGRRMVELPEDRAVERTRITDYYPSTLHAFATDVILAAMNAQGKWAGETCFRNWRTDACIPVLDTHFLIRDPATGRVIGMATITRDISSQKAQRDQLKRANEQLAEAQRLAHVGSWQWDLRTGKIEWSEEMYRIFGLDPARPLRMPLFLDPDASVPSDESKARARAAVEQTLADGSPYDVELEFTRADGSPGWVAARGEALRDEVGHIIGINGTSADITRLKELQRLRDEWTSVIAHDLRQPIGTILMASDFLPQLHGAEPGDEERAFIERIHTAAGSLQRMVDDLLDMSLLEANRLKLERKSTDPRELVRETVERLAHLPGIQRVHVRADSSASPIFVDPMRIEQLLSNLISNAIKYGDEHTDINVALAEHEADVEITVANRGAGIAPDELPRLFNRFIRSRATRGSNAPGLGIGLYIAKGIAEAHGGRLWAESIPGEWTTFHVALPVAAKARVAA